MANGERPLWIDRSSVWRVYFANPFQDRRSFTLALGLMGALICAQNALANPCIDAQAAPTPGQRIRLWTACLSALPNLSPSNQAILYNNRGFAYRQDGDYTQAIADLDHAIKLNPKLPDAYNNRGAIYGLMRRYDKAIADFSRAMELRPHYAKARSNRALAYVKEGEYARALSDDDGVIKDDPDSANAYNEAAWLLATCPVRRVRDGRRAVHLALAAVKLADTWEDHDTLAASYARDHRFANAVKQEQDAIAMANSQGATAQVPRMTRRLSLYRSRKAYVEPRGH